MLGINILNGAKILVSTSWYDARGSFVKTFQESKLAEAGIHFTLRESYFSISKKDVIRGMHFQLPPYQHSKIVFCPQGSILDVIVDMRKNSPTYRQFYAHELSAENSQAFFIPEGFAHGFKSLTDDAITYYLVSTEYNKEYDAGVKYDSIGLDWCVKDPIISERDLSLGRLEDFVSPF